MRTHVIEAGHGPAVVFLHSGEFGGCAESSWGALLPRFAIAGYRAVAPDWLGFGRTDKVVDFGDPKGRRLRHIASVVTELGIEGAAFVGASMGGTYLVQSLAEADPILLASAAVLVSGGGAVPDNAARRATLDYDLTEEGMASLLRTMMHSPQLAEDEDYIRWRHRLSLEPGAWQCTASARLRPPGRVGTSSATEFGRPDLTGYEQVAVPTLVIAGANDPLRLPGYAKELFERIPDSELVVYPECGHMPNLEEPDRFVADVVEFLDRRYRE
jgi:pimeloyl-ACP methyl ester carboxylesterase